MDALEKQFALPGGTVAEHPLLRHWVSTMERRGADASTARALGGMAERELSDYFTGAVASLPSPKDEDQWTGFFKGLAGIQKTGKNHERYQVSRGKAEEGRG